ncbi:hypothetical protein C8F01DRAFT_214228 [Mycena amicta]|nr:hypothetical protein C8F01DRAFT_214228 [Mycena amicta]
MARLSSASSYSSSGIPSHIHIYALLALAYTNPATARVIIVSSGSGSGTSDPTSRNIAIIISILIIVLCITILVVRCYRQKHQRAAALANVEAGAGARDDSFLQQQEYTQQGEGPLPPYTAASGDNGSSFVSQAKDRDEKFPVPTYSPPPMIQEPQPTYDRSGISAPIITATQSAGDLGQPGFRRGYLPRPGDMRRTPSPSPSYNRQEIGRPI